MNWWNEFTQLQKFSQPLLSATIIVNSIYVQLLGIANEQDGTDIDGVDGTDVDSVDGADVDSVDGADMDTSIDLPDDYETDVSDLDSTFDDGSFDDDGTDVDDAHDGLRLFTLEAL